MKIYRYYIFLISCLLLTACTQDNEWLNEEESTQQGVVHLNLQNAEIDVNTRSTTPQDPLTDNPMYDLCLLHYNSEGQLIKGDTQLKDFGEDQPALKYTWSPTLTIEQNTNPETLCLVANLKGNYPTPWPERLADLKEACVDLKFGNSGLIAERKMYMFGYYEGIITAGQNINIMMGRMAAALKFVTTATGASESSPYKINKIEIVNTPKQSYFFPHNSTDGNFSSSSDISETFSSSNQIDNETKELVFYYQIGENISPSEKNQTKVIITAQKGERYNAGSSWRPNYQYRWGEAKSYTVVLGCDAPKTTNRNYSLYRNNNYTFNINLID